ncbi:MAG: DUF6553 family protein [Lachnospiraceae bacterium]|jgi:hypothetical protein
MDFSEESAFAAQFYRETDRTRREAILTEMRGKMEDTDRLSLMERVYRARYGKAVRKGGLFGSGGAAEPDRYIRGILMISMISPASSGHGRRKGSKQLESALAEFGLAEDGTAPDGTPGTGQVIGYELYNACLLYLDLCLSDRTYGSAVLGFGHMSRENLVRKIADEVGRMTKTVPAGLGREREMRTFTEAMKQAFLDTFPDQAELIGG